MGTGVAPPLGWRSVAPLQQMSPSKAPEMKNKMVLELIYYHFIFHPPVLDGAGQLMQQGGVVGWLCTKFKDQLVVSITKSPINNVYKQGILPGKTI